MSRRDTEATERLSAYLDGELDAAERDTVEAHLAASSEGRERLEGLRAVVEGLRELEPAAPPPSLDRLVFEQARLERERASLLDRLESQLGRFQQQNPTWVLLAVVLALAAFAYFLALGVHLGDEPDLVVVPAPPGDHVVGTRFEAAGRALFWDGEAWREPGTEGRPVRPVTWGTADAEMLRAAHPALESIERVTETLILELGGEVVALLPPPVAPAAGDAEDGTPR